jgi:hypothetical protein
LKQAHNLAGFVAAEYESYLGGVYPDLIPEVMKFAITNAHNMT